ncbi:hypothetical protein [Azospirillum sp. sgz301742]
MAATALKRNVRDLGSVIDLVQLTEPGRTDVVAGLSELRERVCCHATDCRMCRASVSCESLLVRAFAGNWGCQN